MTAASAARIDRNAALLKAQRFMPGKQLVAAGDAAAARARAPRKQGAFHIFNAADNGGFVIVSADDRATEILGYALQGNLGVPPNVQWWLEGYARQIESLETAEPMKTAARRASDKAIAPMLTAQWNQTAPYNSWCPDGNYVDYDDPGYDATNRCLTGCVATAMAEFMHYWRWPLACEALDSYAAHGHTVKELPATTFKWEQMQTTYAKTATGPLADAVAELMRYCGQAMEMQYATDKSTANLTVETMISTFHYSPNCRLLRRDSYTTSRWTDIIYDELEAGRPVLYQGENERVGHLLIVDGSDGKGLFHINWGWGGQYDGFFALSALSPGTHGNYQYDQYAFVGLQPAQESEQLLPAMQCSVSESSDAYLHYRSESYDLEGSVVARYNLEPAATRKVEIGWALYQGDTFVQAVSSKAVTISAQQQSHFLNNPRVTFSSDLPSGTYLLCQIYRFEGESEWQLCHPYQDNPYMLVLELTDTYFYARLFDVVKDGINATTMEPTSNGIVYDLQGRRVDGTLRKGVFIKDGHKVFVK